MKEMRECSVCGSLHPMEILTEFNGEYLCEVCLHTETTHCQRCGERIWMDDNAGDNNTALCQTCYDRYYTSCEHCNRVILESDAYYEDDDGDPMCYDCHCRHRANRAINDYYFKPEPIFYGDGSRYLGVELEIDEGGESDSRAKQLLSIANRVENRMYCKHDGSLDDGIEMVTHPMTLEIIRKNDAHRSKLAFGDYCPGWTDEEFTEAETSVSGIEYATLMTTGDSAAVDVRIAGALNNILQIYGVPEELRKQKIRKVLAMDCAAIGRRIIREFREYIEQVNEQAVEDLLRK